MPRNPRRSSRNTRSRAMRNLTSAGVGILNATGKLAAKGTEKTVKWLATDHYGTADFCDVQGKIMDMQWNMNFFLAKMNLSNRRMRRFSERMERRFNSGDSSPNGIDLITDWTCVATGWIIDHLLYLLEILWGFIQPILEFLFWSIVRIVIIIVCMLVMWGALFWLITS